VGIRYHDKRASQRRERLYRSHLWAVDLGCFEVAATRGRQTRVTTQQQPPRIQLSLPFEDDGAGGTYISGRALP
jgi:hypothetical protein